MAIDALALPAALLAAAAALGLAAGCPARPAPGSTEVPVRPDPTPPASSPADLVAAAAVATDDAFRAVLTGDGQDAEHVAPEALRRFLAPFTVKRMSLDQGYAFRDGRHALVWFCGELVLEGAERDAEAAVARAMQAAGMGPPRAEGDRLVFRAAVAANPGVEQTATVEIKRGWTGSAPPIGLELLWEVVGPPGAARPTVGEVLAALPFVRDPRVEAAIWDALAPLAVVRATRGGTWTRYYSVSLDLAAPEGAAAGAADPATVAADALRTAGYAPSEGRGPEELERKATGSFAQIKAEAGEVSVHLQPES